MDVWVLIVETKGGHVYTAGVFDSEKEAFERMIPYSDKLGQDNAWINKRKINIEHPRGW